MKINYSQAVIGYLRDAELRHSPHTISDYSITFRKFAEWLDSDPVLDDISSDQVKTFLASLAQRARPLSKKTILNYHTGLSALWTWATVEGYANRHILREVPRPKPEKRVIRPLTESDIKAILGVVDRSTWYDRPGKIANDHRRPTARRDRAIILTLLDTGMRASELCRLTIEDADLRNQRVYVFGKGSKERMLPLSARTTKTIWRYLTKERGQDRLSSPLFSQRNGQPITRTSLRQLLLRLGQRAGVRNVHPHRFRHTFAINSLRNGMNAYALKMALGHSTMEMVRQYLELVQADLDAAHRRASPVEHWQL